METNNKLIKGRGAVSNRPGRFARQVVERDPAYHLESAPETEIHEDLSKTILTRNSSPDIPFSQSINPYKGCEHGCSYCYARVTHSYLDHSPGRDFETQIYYKPRAREMLRQALAKPGYRPEPIALGANTDPYQPVERRLRITRGILEELSACGHPATIVTKGSLIERDLDLLAGMAKRGLAAVWISITTLDDELKRRMEPRAASPARRLRTMEKLTAAAVPTGLLLAPIIPAINDHEIEAIVAASASAGAVGAGYVLLRLPHELRELFVEWLKTHFPDRASHVMSLLKQMRGGRANDPRFHHRQVGAGPLAELIAKRFHAASRKAGLEGRSAIQLNTDGFVAPPAGSGQLSLL